jgi:hypothetical protein
MSFATAASGARMGDRLDPAKVIGSKKCGECHKTEYKVLTNTKHFKTFKTLHKSKEAKAILKKLKANKFKIRSAKRGVCRDCHYTAQAKKGSKNARAVAGISCESCHGAARDWLDVHNDYGKTGGGAEAKHETETAKHKKVRIAKVIKLGMIRPERSYDLTKNCLQCHTIPNEDIVEKGGHKAGSDFELVSWLDKKKVRHTYSHEDSKHNKAMKGRSSNSKALLYVVGRALDLEYSLRAVAKATRKGPYLKSMVTRTRDAICKVKDIQKKKAIPELKSMLAIAGKAKLKAKQSKALSGAADKVAQLTRKMAAKNNGSKWKALGSLVAKGQYTNKSCR